MTPGELRALISNPDTGIFKMSLGRRAQYRAEAFRQNVLVFQSEALFYEAVVGGDEAAVRRAGNRLRSDNHPNGNPPSIAISSWRQGILTFRSLPRRSLVVHWEAGTGTLHWGIVTGEAQLIREEFDERGQRGLIFHRPLEVGWRSESIGGLLLNGLHPKVQDMTVNKATIHRVQTDQGYLRALISDLDTAAWETRPEWEAKAKKANWRSRPRTELLERKRVVRSSPLVIEIADGWESEAAYWESEIRRMAATAIHTVAYANGQTVLTTIKNKTIGFSRNELEQEIAYLLERQHGRCALTGYEFKAEDRNPHLRPSLDRIDSTRGYIPGNLQVVTRAANFYKSASDEEDWKRKADALYQMALAMQR